MSDPAVDQGPHLSTVSSPASEASPATGQRLNMGVIWAFTLSRVAFSLMGVMFGVYLMKYATDVLLIAPATMGILIAAQEKDGAPKPPKPVLDGSAWKITFPVKVYSMVRFSVTPEVNAASTVLIGITLLLTAIALWLQNRPRRESNGEA